MPARYAAIGIPKQLSVIVGVQIDEAGCDDQASRIDNLWPSCVSEPANFSRPARPLFRYLRQNAASAFRRRPFHL